MWSASNYFTHVCEVKFIQKSAVRRLSKAHVFWGNYYVKERRGNFCPKYERQNLPIHSDLV